MKKANILFVGDNIIDNNNDVLIYYFGNDSCGNNWKPVFRIEIW